MDIVVATINGAWSWFMANNACSEWSRMAIHSLQHKMTPDQWGKTQAQYSTKLTPRTWRALLPSFSPSTTKKTTLTATHPAQTSSRGTPTFDQRISSNPTPRAIFHTFMAGNPQRSEFLDLTSCQRRRVRSHHKAFPFERICHDIDMLNKNVYKWYVEICHQVQEIYKAALNDWKISIDI